LSDSIGLNNILGEISERTGLYLERNDVSLPTQTAHLIMTMIALLEQHKDDGWLNKLISATGLTLVSLLQEIEDITSRLLL
jgi:hypothetical protein